MTPAIEKISAVTFRVVNMTDSVRFYRDVLGMDLLYGGEGTGSLRCVQKTPCAILNLKQGNPVPRWGRLIFHVTDVDALLNHLRDRGSHPETPRDASWGERYFHMPDPDSHELSFARPLLKSAVRHDRSVWEARKAPRDRLHSWILSRVSPATRS